MAAPAFRGVFGKPFGELSKDERKKVGSYLKKCSNELWVETVLAPPFGMPEDYPMARRLAAIFERYGAAPKKFSSPVLGGPSQQQRSRNLVLP